MDLLAPSTLAQRRHWEVHVSGSMAIDKPVCPLGIVLGDHFNITQETQTFCSSPSDSEISSPFENHITGRPLPYPRSTSLPLLAEVMLYLRMYTFLSNMTEAEIQRPSFIWVELSNVAVV